jgi:hypothetical protein
MTQSGAAPKTAQPGLVGGYVFHLAMPCWLIWFQLRCMGRAYGSERAMDNLGAIAGPLLALG